MPLHLGHFFCFHSSYETGPWHLGQRYDMKSRTSKAVTGKKMPPIAHANALRFFRAAKAPVMAADTAQTATYPIRVPDTDDELFMLLASVLSHELRGKQRTLTRNSSVLIRVFGLSSSALPAHHYIDPDRGKR